MTNAAIITAAITAIGNESTVPDNDKAADALIALDGEHLCSVTLIDGAVWGSVDHWCDTPSALDHDDLDRYQLIQAIEEAVQGALASTEATSGPAKGAAAVERFDEAL